METAGEREPSETLDRFFIDGDKNKVLIGRQRPIFLVELVPEIGHLISGG
jgi:hypothetical protein